MTRRAADDRLFLTEGEIALKVGIAALDWQAAAHVLEKSACHGRTRDSASVDIGRLCAPFWTDAPGWRSLSPR
jgi:hypothetical protein